MEGVITAALLATTALTDLVQQRVSWGRLPERKKLPCVVAHRIPVSGRLYTFKGRSPTTQWLVQFDCWAESDKDACAVRDALIEALDGQNEAPLQAFVERDHSSWDDAEAPGAQRTTDIFRASVDARVWHRTA